MFSAVIVESTLPVVFKFKVITPPGPDPLAIELHWRRLYEVIAHIVGKNEGTVRGIQFRAIGALRQLIPSREAL